jgi:hypothetical protein
MYRTDALAESLMQLSSSISNSLSYQGAARRSGLHGLIQYPAMMVPRMQADIIDVILSQEKAINTICDPFSGSGTILTECLRRGKSFIGSDINPLSILTCRVKTKPFMSDSLKLAKSSLARRIAADKSNAISTSFPHRNKWFTKSAQIHLSRISRAISVETNPDISNVFWLAFAESIRKCSLSRTSTYKLHIKAAEEIEKTPHPLAAFESTLNSIIDRFSEEETILKAAGFSPEKWPHKKVELSLKDARELGGNSKSKGKFDLLVSSPPYGDNKTTIPYGQFSYLPSSWIPMSKLVPEVNEELLGSTQSLDTASLGGSNKDALEKATQLAEISKSFNKFKKVMVKAENSSGLKRASSFTFDFYEAIESVQKRANDNALFVWVLGNRTIGGEEFPLDEITREIMEHVGASHVCTLDRVIPQKRMPTKNSISNLMGREKILIMRKVAD